MSKAQEQHHERVIAQLDREITEADNRLMRLKGWRLREQQELAALRERRSRRAEKSLSLPRKS